MLRLILPCPPDPDDFESDTVVDVETDADGTPTVSLPPAGDAE